MPEKAPKKPIEIQDEDSAEQVEAKLNAAAKNLETPAAKPKAKAATKAADSDETAVKVNVVKKSAPVKAPAEPKTEESESTTIQVRNTSMAQPSTESAEEKTDEDQTNKPMNHRGATLQPLSATEKTEPTKVAGDRAEAPKPNSESTEPSEETKPTADPEPINEAAPADAKPKTEAAPVELKPIYDTKQYHLPIKVSHHHRSGTMVHPLLTVFILAVLFALIGLAAVDLEIFDISIELPFDFL